MYNRPATKQIQFCSECGKINPKFTIVMIAKDNHSKKVIMNQEIPICDGCMEDMGKMGDFYKQITSLK